MGIKLSIPCISLWLSLRRKKVIKGTITIAARNEKTPWTNELRLLIQPSRVSFNIDEIFSAKFIEPKKGYFVLIVNSNWAIEFIIVSLFIEFAIASNWFMSLGNKIETNVKSKIPVRMNMDNTASTRGTLRCSKKSTTGLNIIEIKIDTARRVRMSIYL